MNDQTRKRILTTIIAAFFLLSATYSVVVPPFEASDELWHYPMVKYIADHWSLPVQEPGVETPWRQEGSQPPLYYIIGALATSWIDTSDMAQVRHLNPHADNGIATPDGNVNLVVHRPEREAFPWRGTVLAVHVVRFLSVLMMTAGVYLTYRIVREVFPQATWLALGAAAIHAFTPMVVFIGGAVNNDNLVVPLSSLALLMLIRMANERMSESANERISESANERISEAANQRSSEAANERRQTWKTSVTRYLMLGVVLGLAALTKTSSLGLTLLTALVVTVRAVRRRSWREFFIGGFCTLLPVLAIAGWWYLRNLRLYGDLTGLNVFIEILGQRDVPADLAQLWRERFSFLAGYWGNFGGLNVPMPSWAYTVLNTTLVLAALGLILVIASSIIRHSPFVSPFSILNSPFSIPHSPFSILLCFLWGLAVVIPWIQWARVTWSSQGRLIFAALPVWSMLLALGLGGWLPRRWGRWVVAAFALFLLTLSTVTPFVWIRPAYALPEPLSDAQVADIPHRVDAKFGKTMRLLGYDLTTEATQPGGAVEVTLYWEALAPTQQDYTVFVHLLGQHDLLIAQRDTLPGLGLLSTTWLEPGYRWADRYVVPIPETAYAPDEAQVAVGLYNATTGVRRQVTAPDGEALGDNVRFGRIAIQPRAGEVPNPIAVNFGGRMLLEGYDLSSRTAHPGETITLTLHWRALRSMETNYTISAQLIDHRQQKAAQMDSWPQDGDAPTVAWKRGSRIIDKRSLTISQDAPPGEYNLRVAVYDIENGKIVHLSTISQQGEMLSNYVKLTRFRVTPPH
jgi:4-amino-4-deoxy-L-arabinose transferase-like glycosyltransferase